MPDKQTISEALDVLESDATKLVNLCAEVAQAHNGDLYAFDLLAICAAKRSLALSSGFRSMIRDKNLICGGALLRLQLDTALRFFAGFLVADPHRFAMDFFAGQQVRKMKDVDGTKMSDSYLADKLSAEFPWVRSLYDETCEYVHLSGIHMSHAIDGTVQPDNTFVTSIGAVDSDLPDQAYLSAIVAFQQSTLIFVKYLKGWIFSKSNPELIAKMKADRDAASRTS